MLTHYPISNNNYKFKYFKIIFNHHNVNIIKIYFDKLNCLSETEQLLHSSFRKKRHILQMYWGLDHKDIF